MALAIRLVSERRGDAIDLADGTADQPESQPADKPRLIPLLLSVSTWPFIDVDEARIVRRMHDDSPAPGGIPVRLSATACTGSMSSVRVSAIENNNMTLL